ncbi:MAG: CDP-diacylglycerol--glycerol-3-phosphate 3-phosphatidyltransferase [Elusimicrobia bacterium]|nr:CDP-diacylglycerol--glycerol-3-phosphate 3-phosphatidyltransferase [Elusimicrobiota bacterium]
MTLANKITVLRVIAVPLLVIALLHHHDGWARLIFCLSIASDALDGSLARWRGERTPLGSFLDPLADKLLLVATFLVLTFQGHVPLWIFVVLFSRDLLIALGWTIIYILTSNAKVQPRFLGKMTTILQMVAAVALLFRLPPLWSAGLLHLMVAVSIISLLDYIYLGNRRLSHLE